MVELEWRPEALASPLLRLGSQRVASSRILPSFKLQFSISKGKFILWHFNGCFKLLQKIRQNPNGRGRHLSLDLAASRCDIREAQ